MTDSNPADLYNSRFDDGEWDDEEVVVKVRQKTSEVVSFRIPADELDSLQRAAERAGESVSEFIRRSISSRLEETSSASIQDVTLGARALLVMSTHRMPDSHVSSSWVPDFPPPGQTVTGNWSTANLTSVDGVVPEEERQLPINFDELPA